MATFAQGWVESRIGEPGRAIALMKEGLAQWDRTGFKTWQPIFSALLGRALIEAGALDEAERIIEQADGAILLSGEEQARPLRHKVRRNVRGTTLCRHPQRARKFGGGRSSRPLCDGFDARQY